ncbi:Periostin [Sphaceloma murrayae]|uniref:Periostin n=1 Tax=Sphaceloma murrayae TaxID=2082308 RepID=A0A2K1QIX7_9PEZI|nr:Periostin [Sphaceloma murrayae]
MKLLNLLPLAPLASAFTLPNQEIFQELSRKTQDKYAEARDRASWTKDAVQDGVDGIRGDISDITRTVKSRVGNLHKSAATTLDDALAFGHEAGKSLTDEIFDAQSWISSGLDQMYDAEERLNRPLDHEHDGRPPHRKPPPHHKKPHHGHGPPNETVYQLISNSKYTTKLAGLINEFPDLVEALNGTKANYTIFAPTDKAFEKIPEDAPKPSKEVLKKILSYHVSSDFYPAGRVLVTHTIPTLLVGDELSSQPVPQRLSVNIGLRGLTLDFYARVIAIDIFGTNGVIHGLDSLLIPPPRSLKIIDLLPGEFSTLELALVKTGLLDDLAKDNSKGGTLFAPSNFAFQKLGPRVNGFLFSKYGLKYLKALLQYHLVPEITLYSDAAYFPKDDEDKNVLIKDVPKGYYHFDLPTLLEDRELSVDVARYGGFISIKVNGFARVTVQDGIARDGVIHVVGDVLVPPKKFPPGMTETDEYEGGEICVEELKRRLEPYL